MVFIFLGLVSFTANAEWYNEYTFVVGSNVDVPITVIFNGKNYTVYKSLTINTTGNTYTPSATDKNGNSLKYEVKFYTQTKGGDTYHYNTYTFYAHENYGASENKNVSSGNAIHQNSYNSSYNPSSTGARIGQGLANISATRAFDESGAYPGLHAGIGISKGFGEFVRLRLAAGGFQVYGGIGKDWFLNGVNCDKFLWHTGLGGYVSLGEDESRWGDVSFGLTVAENAAWEKLSLTFDLGFTYWFGRWRRIGAFAGTGIGWGEIKNIDIEGEHSKLAWNLEVGIVVRLAHF